jgi:hypothetical protein
MLVISRIRHGRLSLTGSEPAKKSGQNIPKNRCRTTITERMVETRAELPFIGDQIVCLSHDQAARSGPAQLLRLARTTHRSGLINLANIAAYVVARIVRVPLSGPAYGESQLTLFDRFLNDAAR